MKAETSIFSFLYLSRMVKYAKHEHFFWNIGFDPFLGTTTPPNRTPAGSGSDKVPGTDVLFGK
jgi:hypothetical protein